METFGDLIDLHIADMSAVGKSPRRSKAATLEMLQRKLGKLKMVATGRVSLSSVVTGALKDAGR